MQFTINMGGTSEQKMTVRPTVGAALADAAVALNPADVVAPSVDTPLTDGLQVSVKKSLHVRLMIGANEKDIYTQAGSVGEALLNAGYQVQPEDKVFPSMTTPLTDGMLMGLASQRNIHELLNAQPSFQKAGTYVAPEAAPAPDPSQCKKTLDVWSTYYDAKSAHGTKTRLETGVYKGIVAVDPRVIPLGTHMYVPGYGYAYAADTGGGVKGAWLDAGYGPGDVYDWYSHHVDICLLD